MMVPKVWRYGLIHEGRNGSRLKQLRCGRSLTPTQSCRATMYSKLGMSFHALYAQSVFGFFTDLSRALHVGVPGLKCASGEERHWTRRACRTTQHEAVLAWAVGYGNVRPGPYSGT